MKKILIKTVTIIVAVILTGAFIAVNTSLAEEGISDGRFIAYDDGTVWDTETNLLWAATDNGSDIYWSEAESYCKNYEGGGYKGWRMPTKDELKGLYSRIMFGNNGYHLTKLITLTGAFPWSSYVQGSEAAVVAFNSDFETWFFESVTHKSRNRALPVRDGKYGKVVEPEKTPEIVVPPPPVAPPPPPPPPPPLPAAPPVKEKVTIALNVEFDTAKSVIKKKYHNNIKKVADFMQKYPDTNVVIEGHTDNVDVYHNPETNMKLSQSRADSVRQYLIDKFGIDPSRITAVGYGPTRPIADNNTEEGRKKNRRVEAVIEKMVTVQTQGVVTPPLPVPEPTKAQEPEQEKKSITLNLVFDTAKSVIKKKHHNNIKEVADYMQQNPDTKVVIEGHTDDVDRFNDPERNMKLSQARADSVRQYLIDKFGIDSSRITAVGYGPTRPIADNNTEEGRKKNRRVEAVIEKVTTTQPQEVVAPPPPVPAPAPVLSQPPAPEPVSQAPQQEEQEKKTITLNLVFDTARSVIKKKHHNNIKEVADYMQQNPDTKVVIEGHTDNVDLYHNPETNMKLSQSRADSVRQYLIDKFGIDSSRITAVGYGPTRPIADNNTEEGRKKNRRVEAVIEKMVTTQTQGVATPPTPVPEPTTVQEPVSQTPPAAQEPEQEKKSITLNLVFDTAKAVIKKKHHNNIKEVADYMQQYPDTKVVIEGHTDNVDRFNDPDRNIKLSQSRADSVRQYLIDKFGIDSSRITAVGYGPDKPIADNNTEEGRKKNRRVEAVIEKMVTN